MTEADERTQFESFMARNIARLTTFAQPYVGRMVPDQREEFLAAALDNAWDKRGELKARKTAFAEENVDILHWWEDSCLKPAALTRDQWLLRTWDGRREIISGRRLGRTK